MTKFKTLTPRNSSSFNELNYYTRVLLQEKYSFLPTSQGLLALFRYEGIKKLVIELDDLGNYQSSYTVPKKNV